MIKTPSGSIIITTNNHIGNIGSNVCYEFKDAVHPMTHTSTVVASRVECSQQKGLSGMDWAWVGLLCVMIAICGMMTFRVLKENE